MESVDPALRCARKAGTMTITRMPNGQYVDIAPGTSPDVVARIRAQNAPTRAAAPAPRPSVAAPRGSGPSTVRQPGQRYSPAELQARVASASDPLKDIPIIGDINRGVRAVSRGMTFGLDNVAGALGGGVASAAQGRGFGTGFREQRQSARQQRDADKERSPIATMTGDVVGAVAAPVGSTLRAASAGVNAGRAALAGRNLTGVGRAADAGLNVAQSVARRTGGPIGSAAVQGAVSGGLTTLTDTGDLGRAAESAVGGGLFGGALGAVA